MRCGCGDCRPGCLPPSVPSVALICAGVGTGGLGGRNAIYLDIELPMSCRHGLHWLHCKDRAGKGKGEALGLLLSPVAMGDAERKPGPKSRGAHPALSQDGPEPRIRRGGTGAASTKVAPFLSAWGKKKGGGRKGRELGKKRGRKRLFPTGLGRPTPPPGGAVAPRRGQIREGGQPDGASPTGRTDGP